MHAFWHHLVAPLPPLHQRRTRRAGQEGGVKKCTVWHTIAGSSTGVGDEGDVWLTAPTTIKALRLIDAHPRHPRPRSLQSGSKPRMTSKLVCPSRPAGCAFAC